MSLEVTMESIVILEEDVFNQLASHIQQHGAGTFDQDFKDRVEAKLRPVFECTCFTAPPIEPPPPNAMHSLTPRHNSSFKSYASRKPKFAGGRGGHGISRPTTRVSKIGQQIPESQRKTMALLNKINATNFHAIFKQIASLPKTEDLVHLVLKKAAHDRTYMFVLCKCLKDLRSLEHMEEHIDSQVKHFVHTFLASLDSTIAFFDVNNIQQQFGYDDLCTFIKYKTVFIQKMLIVTKLIQLHLVPFLTQEEFYGKIKDLLVTHIENQNIADVLIQGIAEMHAMDVNSNAAHMIQRDLLDTFGDLTSWHSVLSNKTRFKVLSILEN